MGDRDLRRRYTKFASVRNNSRLRLITPRSLKASTGVLLSLSRIEVCKNFSLFLDHIHIGDEHGLTAKSLIVADFAGINRWEMLSMHIALSTPETWEADLDESQVLQLERIFVDHLCDQLLEAYGDPATVSYKVLPDNRVDWKRSRLMLPSVVNVLPHLSAQSGYITSLAIRDLVRRLAPPQSHLRRSNPFEMVMRVYESGLLIDFANWRFTNKARQDLGPLPEAPLPVN